jgi:hypothetical protein
LRACNFILSLPSLRFLLEWNSFQKVFLAVLRIWFRRIHMFLGLPDPHPDPLVRDTYPDPSVIKEKL